MKFLILLIISTFFFQSVALPCAELPPKKINKKTHVSNSKKKKVSSSKPVKTRQIASVAAGINSNNKKMKVLNSKKKQVSSSKPVRTRQIASVAVGTNSNSKPVKTRSIASVAIMGGGIIWKIVLIHRSLIQRL